MLYKYIECHGQTHGSATFDQGFNAMPGDTSQFLTKAAASTVPMTEEMRAFWEAYPKKMPDRFLYFRVNILGAGEYWSSNRNGDYFPESVLKQYHKTFHHARLFLHHKNKDPNKSHGRVIFSTYNDAPYAKRVEVILAIDRKDPRIQDTIRKIERGERIEVSMGCRVPYDLCSICQNKASTRKQYCSHLKNEMNKLYPDGRRVMAINPDPAFFDVSIVTIPADPSSGGMEKIAKAHAGLSSALLGEIYDMRSKYADYKKAEEKEATIEKTGPDDKERDQKEFIPKDVEGKKDELQELGGEIGRNDKDMSEHMLDQISDFPIPEILGTLGGLKVPLRPAEFTCIVIKKTASFDAAKVAYREGAEFVSAPPRQQATFDIMSDFNPKLAHIVRPLMGKRSMYPHFVNDRKESFGHIKIARKVQIDHPEAAAFYAAYVRDVTNLDQTKVAAILTRYPDVRDEVTGALEDVVLHKTASVHDIVRDSYIGQELLKGAYEK